LPGAGTYVTPSLNHAGCVITNSEVISFSYLFLSGSGHIVSTMYIYGGRSPGAGTYVTPSLNHDGCVITNSEVFSFSISVFLLFLSIWF
jgi:hypothetical protein